MKNATTIAPPSCGCNRRVFMLCDVGASLWRALRDELPYAMWSGEWSRFDDLRDSLEAHLFWTKP